MLSRIAATRQPLTLVENASTKANRNQLLADIQLALAPFDLTYEIENEANELTIIVKHPDLLADIWFQKNLPADMTIISWYTSTRSLQPVPLAWDEKDMNLVHRRKATSQPDSFRDLVRMLVVGFTAVANGTAFEPHPVADAA